MNAANERKAVFLQVASAEAETGDRVLLEAIGAVVSMPNAGGEVFAVHQVTAGTSGEPFRVSHVATGLLAGVGDTIRAAISDARSRMTRNSPSVIAEAIARGRATRLEVEREVAARKAADVVAIPSPNKIH